MLMSIIQFIVTPRIFIADYQEEENDKTNNDAGDPPFVSPFLYYTSCARVFVPMKNWLLVVKIIVFGAVAVSYFLLKGPELTYAIYIPLDFLLEMVLLSYRVTEKYLIDRERKRN